MSRARWAAWGLAAGLSLTAGCCSPCRPLFRPCCAAGACAPECEGCAGGVPAAEGPVLPDYGVPAEGIPPGAVLPPGAAPIPPLPMPPATATVPGLSPQPTVPPLSPPPQRLVPQATPEPYRP